MSASTVAIIGLAACQGKTTDANTPAQNIAASSTAPETVSTSPAAESQNSAPTIQDAKEFLEQAETEIVGLSLEAAKVYWIQSNFITEDTNFLAAKAFFASSFLW